MIYKSVRMAIMKERLQVLIIWGYWDPASWSYQVCSVWHKIIGTFSNSVFFPSDRMLQVVSLQIKQKERKKKVKATDQNVLKSANTF